MAWEHRQRGGRYFTTTERVGRRRIRHYYGTGTPAELAATTLEQRRLQREVQRRQREHLRAELATAADALRPWDEVLRCVLRAMFLAAGLRQHHRGEWRRSRWRPSELASDCPDVADRPQDVLGQLFELVVEAERGNTSAVIRLRPLVADEAAVWRLVEALSRQAEEALVKQAALGEPEMEMTYRAWLSGLRVELLSPEAGILERLLVERILHTHLLLARTESLARDWPGDAVQEQRLLQRGLRAAKRRLVQATRALELFRKHEQTVAEFSGVRRSRTRGRRTTQGEQRGATARMAHNTTEV